VSDGVIAVVSESFFKWLRQKGIGSKDLQLLKGILINMHPWKFNGSSML